MGDFGRIKEYKDSIKTCHKYLSRFHGLASKGEI